MKLDYGCGYWNLKKGWKNADTFSYLGIDYTIDPKTGKIKDLENKSCDIINLRNVLHHVKDMSLVFKEIDRLLKNKGKVVISEPKKEKWIGNVILDIWWYRIRIPRLNIWFSLKWRDWKSYRNNLNYNLIKKKSGKYSEVEIWQKN